MFNKNDLKTGMLVITRDEQKWIVVKDYDYLDGKGCIVNEVGGHIRA